MNAYKIDYTANTITITAAFAKAMQTPSSEEYALIQQIQHDFPKMRIVSKTHRTSKKTNPAKGLTYAHMERYIKAYENVSELLEAFQKVKELAASQTNSYLYVKTWFLKQFPNYKEIPSFKNGKLYVLPIPAPDTEKCNFSQSEVA